MNFNQIIIILLISLSAYYIANPQAFDKYIAQFNNYISGITGDLPKYVNDIQKQIP